MGDATDERDAKGRFRPGWRGGPGNPNGRRVAELRRAAFDAVTAEDLTEVMRAAVDAAKAGDVHAIRFVVERVAGKGDAQSDVAIDLPDISTVDGMAQAQRIVAAAAAAGEIVTEDALKLSALLRQASDATLLEQVAARVARIEQENKR